MLGKIRTLRLFLLKTKEDYVSAFSAQSALFIIISAFPLIIMILNLIQFLPITKTDLTYIMVRAMPDALEPFIINIIDELYRKSSGTLISLTALTTLWSASKGTLSVVRGLNSIYQIKETRNFITLRFISIIYTIILILTLLFTLTILVFGNTLYIFIATRFLFLETLANILILLRPLLALSVLTLFFALLYKIIPNRPTSLMLQTPGALFAASGWMFFSFFFSIYIDNFSNFSYMYGSITAIVLIMLWLYFCMYILFIGAEINVFFEPNIKATVSPMN